MCRLTTWPLCGADGPTDVTPSKPSAGPVSQPERHAPPDEETAVPPLPVDPRLQSLPLVKQVCEAQPPIWAKSSRDTPLVAQWSHAPWFLDSGRLLWGRHVLDTATGERVAEFPFGADADPVKTRLSHTRRYAIVSQVARVDPRTFQLPWIRLQVWDLEMRAQHGRDLALDQFGEVDADITADGNTVAVATRGEVALWDTVSGARLRAMPVPLDDFEKGYQGRPPFFAPEFLRFSPDGHWLVVFSPNNVLYWQWQTEEKPRVLHAGRRLQSFAFTPDSRYLAEAPGPRTNLHVRDMSSFDIERTLFDEVDSPMITTGLAFTADGATLIAGNDITVDERKMTIPHRLHFWDVRQGKLVRQMALPLYRPRWLDVSPNGRFLAVRLESNDTAVLAVWDLQESADARFRQ